jgi:tetratricopeptide (TPR) repeat protein
MDRNHPADANWRASWVVWTLLAVSSGLTAVACDDNAGTGGRERASVASKDALPSAEVVALAGWRGDHQLDERIRKQQERVRNSKLPAEELERLGWLFVTRARELGDPGSYNMALQCALAIEARSAGSRAALLLRGHALHSLHHFAQAEPIARQLVAERGMASDFGLLGDVLLDRGELDEAIDAYQRMVEIRPDAHSYARAAQARYLKGDLSGALAAMEMACRAASPRNRESFAWVWSRLAQYQLQSGALDAGLESARRAREVAPESATALKAEAQAYLARSEPERALTVLNEAIERSLHPELLSMMIEALTALGRTEQAEVRERQLLARGAGEDPRAFALYLASQRRDLGLAAQLVEQELRERKDVYSYEALAWVQSAQGRHAEALENAKRSLAEGTRDPRLLYHAGLIAERAGDAALARIWLTEAQSGAALLLPSERGELSARTRAL